MSDEQQAMGSEQESGSDTQRGAGSDSQRAADGETQGGDDLSGMRSALEKERRNGRDLERRVKDLTTRLTQREQAELTDAERAAARLKDYETKEQEWEREKRDHRLQTAALTLATKTGALYPEQLHRLIDRGAVEWTDDGQPRNLASLVNEIKRDYPALFRSHGGAGNADAGAGSGGNHVDSSMNDLIRRAAGHA